VNGVDCGRNHLRKDNAYFSFDFPLDRAFHIGERIRIIRSSRSSPIQQQEQREFADDGLALSTLMASFGRASATRG